jgi:glucose 1-dehydrogenase
MTIELNDKVALITGGARGIGFGIARRFLSANAKVAIVALHEESLRAATERLTLEFGENVQPIPGDVSLAQDVEKMVQETLKRFGTIDILVNNAGAAGLSLFWETSVEEWDRIFNVNLRGAFLCASEVVRFMLDKGIKGKIINISSVSDSTPNSGTSAYCASKAGLSMFTKVAALELGPYRINVNAIAAGFTLTAMAEPMLSLPTAGEAYLERTPMGSYGEPDDIARVALFLASTYADWITGQTISVDGGLSLLGPPNKCYEEFIKLMKTGGI